MPNLGEILRKNLPQDIMSQIEDVVGDDYDWDVVPRTRLNKVIAQRNSLQEQLDGKGNDVDLSKYILKEDHEKALQDKETELTNTHNTALLNLRKQHAALEAMSAENVIDPQLLLDAGLIKMDSLNFDDAGALTGLTEQLTPLKESKGHLFGKASKGKAGTGKCGNSGSDDQDKSDALDAQLNDVFSRMGIQVNNSQEG